MTEPCLIGVQMADGAIRSIWLKNGGKPDWIGLLLQRYYGDRHEALSLIDLGDMRWLGVNLDECQLCLMSVIKHPYFMDLQHLLYCAKMLGVQYCYVRDKRSWLAYDTAGTRIQIQDTEPLFA